jgi:lipoprotein-releasing system ATP-binding protein
MCLLKAEGIRRTFQGTKGPIEVLKGLDIRVGKGEVVVIVGASGAGKSTLLHILGSLDEPDGGTVLIRGKNPQECSERELNTIRNRDLGFVFQFHHLLPEFSALENVMMPAVLQGIRGEIAETRAVRLLAEVGLAERLSHRPAELSGGEQQRVAVARALMNNPALVLADEPSGNLDDRNSEGLHSLIIELSKAKKQAFIIVTHKKELLGRASRGMVLTDGRLQSVETDSHDLSVL